MLDKSKSEYSDDRARALGIVLEQLVRSLYPERSPGSLQPLQWSILRYFSTAAPENSTVSDAARFLGLSHAPVSRAIQTLVDKKMLEKVDNPEDRRGSRYVLSQVGKTTVDSDPYFALTHAMSGLSETRVVQFEQTLRQVALNIALKKDHQ